MSGLELRVTNLEEQVGGIRESVAVIQTEQKYTVSALGRIEERLDEMRSRSLWSITSALRHPDTYYSTDHPWGPVGEQRFDSNGRRSGRRKCYGNS